MKHSKKKKNDKRWQGGFTLAELLVALGILSILLSIGMVSVTYYQRNLKVTEMDAIAKEIFVSAQNHITASKATVEWEELENQHQSDFEQYFGNRIKEKPSDYPREETWQEGGNGKEHDYHYIVYDGREDTLNSTILDIILPYGAIDDEVRTNGHYVIEYDYKTATVYGVFYTDNSKKFSYENDIMGSSGLNNQYGRENSARGRETRKNYKNDSGHIIIGYYGGATTTELKSAKLQPLEVEVKNGDTLGVTIRDKNYGNIIEGTKVKTKISFTVTGEESQAVKKTILEINPLGNVQSGETWWTAKEEKNIGVYEVTLDDITKQGGHFADIFPDFIAGENLLIEVEAFSNQVLCTPVKTQVATNSLFEAKYGYEQNGTSFGKVSIGNIRHLQNLHPMVSGLPVQTIAGDNSITKSKVVKQVEQTKDLDWEQFINSEELFSQSIYSYNKENIYSEYQLTTGKFYSIDNSAITLYEGFGNSLKNFSIQGSSNGNSGLFSEIGKMESNHILRVQNLTFNSVSSIAVNNGNAGVLLGEAKENSELIAENIQVIDPTVRAQENAGGIVGILRSGKLVQCSIRFQDDEINTWNRKLASEKYQEGAFSEDTRDQDTPYNIISYSANAGGLIGLWTNNENWNQTENFLKQSFASVPVIAKGNGFAGGVIGEIDRNQVLITNTYSSGYTEEGSYTTYNIISLGTWESGAGGFIGKNGGNNVSVQNSYSTSSVYGMQIGGFIGVSQPSDENSYTNCYSTGLVTELPNTNNVVKGAFAGVLSNRTSINYCYYLEGINQGLSGVGIGMNSIEKKTYDELSKKVIFQEIWNSSGQNLTPTLSNDMIETYAYDSFYLDLEENYPFPLVTTTGYKKNKTKTHYGDWPIEQKNGEGNKIGFIYYELLEDENGTPDDKLYYHGWIGKQSNDVYDPNNYTEVFTKGKELINGLSREIDTYVRQEGYLILLEDGIDLDTLYMKIQNDWDTKPVKELLNEKNISLPEQFNGYKAYEFKPSAITSRDVFKNGIPTIIVGNLADPSRHWELNLINCVGVSMNVNFGDAIQFIGEPYDNTIYNIRSARHLYNIKEEGLSAYNGQNNKFVQTIDIDVAREVNGVVYQNTIQQFQNFWATYISKQYKNLQRTYKIKNLRLQLFNNVQSTAVIKGMYLVDLYIESQQEIISGLIDSNSGIIENITLENVVIKGRGTVNGFINQNTTNSKSLKNIKLINVEGKSQGEGTVNGFGDENSAPIENIQLQDIVLTGKGTVNGFIKKNTANSQTLENIDIINLKAESQGEGTVNGFGDENSAPIENIQLQDIILTGKGTVNGFIDKNNFTTETLQNIRIVNLRAESLGREVVNGFVNFNQSTNKSIFLQDVVLSGNGMINGFINKNDREKNKIQEVQIDNLEITGKGVVNGFIEDSKNAIIEKCDLENISLSGSELVNGFGNTLQGNGSVTDVTITNLQAEGKGVVNGFANINKQPINRCSIHAKDVSPNSYENVKLTGEKVYGFVNTNQSGSISNSYVVGNLVGEQIVSGFVNTNSGWGAKIDSCYANIIIESEGTASGFLYRNNNNNDNDNASINNSYVVGSITSLDKESGEVAGFTYPVNAKVDTIQNCYTALWKMSAKKIYPFGLYQAKDNNKNNYWLSVNIMEGEIDTSIGQETVIKKEYTDLMIEQPDVITYKYYSGLKGVDMETKQYPFTASTKNANGEKEFWGDWPLKQQKETTQDVGLLYYEKIGDKVYYHGYLGDFSEKGDNPNYKEVMTKGEGLENGLVIESGKYVTEDGYLILFPKKTENENGSKLTVIVGNEKEGEEQKIPPGQLVLLGKENSFHLEGYDAYYFPCDKIKDKIIGEDFTYLYINIGKKKNQGTTEFETYISFKFNPYFADCITRNDSEPEKYYVRSVR